MLSPRLALALAACAALCGCPTFPDPLLREGGVDDATDIVRAEGGQDAQPDARPDVVAVDAVDAVDAQPDAAPDAAPDVPEDVTPDVPEDVMCSIVGQTVCGGACYDLQTDLAHCGLCTTDCGPRMVTRADGCMVTNTCSAGACSSAVACP